MPLIRFTKVEAARRQLRAAIELWFKDDHIPAQGLAYASYEIVHRYCKRKGIHGLVYDTEAIPDKTVRNRINVALKDTPNWIKHANQDEEFSGSKELDPMLTQLFLMGALIGLMRANEKLRAFEAAFIFWHYLHHPDWFPENMGVKGIPQDMAENMRSLSRPEFLPRFIDFWSEGNIYLVE